jgi:hypothetical protein
MMNTRTHTNRCNACGSHELLLVSMNMEDGGVKFWTCSACEKTGWERDGAGVSREAALSRIPRR